MKKENLSTTVSTAMETLDSRWQRVVEQRSFLNGIGMAGAALSAGTLLAPEGRAENKVEQQQALSWRCCARRPNGMIRQE